MSTLQKVRTDPSSSSLATLARRQAHQIARLGWTGWFLIAVLTAAAALRLYHLGAPSLWLDELGQATVAQRPLLALLDGVRRHHGAAPLDYLLTALMVRTSNAEAVLRFPAALWGVLSVYWLFRLGRRWHSPTAGLIAAILLSVSALHLRYSQELRFYSLFVFLTLASTEALDHAWRSGRWRDWLLFGALAVLMLYAHYYALLVLAFQVAWALALWLEGRSREQGPAARKQMVRFAAMAAATILAFLPWLLYDVLRERGLQGQTTPALTWDVLETTLRAFGGGGSQFWSWWALLAACGLAAQWRRSRANAFFLAVWVLLSLPLIIFIDQAGSYFFHIRQMIFVLPPFLLAVGMGVSALASGAAHVVNGRRGERIARRALLVAMTVGLLASAWPQVTTYFDDQERPEDWRSLGALLSSNLSLDDAIVPWRAERFLSFYSPRTVVQTQDLDSVAELEDLHATGRPLWMIITPYLELEGSLDAAPIRSWIDQQPSIVFDLGTGFKLFYLQAGHDREGLWEVAQHFSLPVDRPDLLIAYAKELGSLDTEVAQNTLVAAAERAQDSNVRADLLFRAGNIAFRRRDYVRANGLFDQALAARPDLAEAYLRKGFALLELGQPQAALAALTTAHEQLGRDDYWVRRWLGIALDRLNRPAEALPHFLAALDRSPDAHEMRFLIGAAYSRLGDRAAAESWLRDYLARDSGGAWVQEAQQLLATLPD